MKYAGGSLVNGMLSQHLNEVNKRSLACSYITVFRAKDARNGQNTPAA